MASFTDKPTQFNPYIETTPVQAEVAVGMQKEQDFKQGIARVQSYVDTIAGLDIAKQEDKDYVSNKLNEVKQGIVENLSGDFSDMRVTNQIGGAASHIYKDPIVQNATISTANYRKGISDMEAAQKAGKSAPENEWMYQKQASEWLNDKTPGTSFNGKYQQYTDVMDDFLKTWKEVHPDSKLTQDAFRFDATGKIVINEALNEESKEGITPDKVKQVADLVFSKPQNQQQLTITGQYKYRDMLPSQMYETLHTNYEETIKNVNKKLIELQVDLATNKSANKTLVSQQIDSWKKFGSDSLEQFKGYSELLQTNPEGAKALLFKNEFTDKVMNAFQWTKQSNEIKDNPLWKAQMEGLKYELDLSKLDLEKEKLAWDKTKDQAEMALKQAKIEADTKGVQTVTVAKNVDEMQANAGSQSFYDIRDGYVGQYNNDAYEGVNTIANASSITPPWKKTESGWIPNVDPTGKTGYKTAKEAHDAYVDIYTNSRATYNNGNGSDPLVNDMFSKLDPTIKAIKYYDQVGSKLQEKYKPVYENLKKALPSDFNVSIKAGGKDVRFSREDMADYWQYENGDKLTSAAAKSKLEKKFGQGITTNLKTSLEPSFFTTYNKFNEQAKKDPSIVTSLVNMEQDYKDAQRGFNPGQTNFVPKNEEEAKALATRFRSLAQERSKGNDASSFTDILSELELTKKDGTFMDRTMGYYKAPSAKGDKYYISVNGKDAEVTAADIQAIFPGTQLSDPFWQKHGTTLGLTGQTKTDIDNTGMSSAYPIKMPSGSKYFVKYHLVGDGKGNYALKLYVNDVKGNVLLKGAPWSLADGLMTQEQTQRVIEKLSSDTVIDAVINQNK